MSVKVLTHEAVGELMEKLKQEARVVAPHRREGCDQWQFADVEDTSKVELNYTSTILPPKKYAFPPTDPLVYYHFGERFSAEPLVEAQPIVLFGVHPCDIYALQCLDISMSDQFVDPNWVARRKAMRIVGVDCMPDEWCFCASMNTATVNCGYDVFLLPINQWQEFVAEPGTEAGEQMLDMVAGREATGEDLAQVREWHTRKINKQADRRINTPVNDLPLHFTRFAESEVWKKWADKCYSCGTCNITCPTCFCFDVLDQLKLTMDEGQRVRTWDGCMLEDFAVVAPAENFREERHERIRHRFYRKYAYLFTRYGRPYCCGCGRCVRQCLADIDPVTVLNELLAEAQREVTSHGV